MTDHAAAVVIGAGAFGASTAYHLARRGVDVEAGRLVDDQEVIVLEGDHQRDVLRLVMRRFRIRDCEAERLAALHLQRGIADRLAVGFQRARPDQHL